MIKLISKKAFEERGATAIEYGIIVAAVSVALIAVIFLCGSTIVTTLQPIIVALGA
jgi:Flp pilus assembly pilin Flp